VLQEDLPEVSGTELSAAKDDMTYFASLRESLAEVGRVHRGALCVDNYDGYDGKASKE
jgi:hypothetical protein